jgi:hypothetical protein
MSNIEDNCNPYRSPAKVGYLIESGWLYRKIQLPTPLSATVEYSGRGVGFESVRIDGLIVARKTNLLWFVPHFDFVVSTPCGDLAGAIDVRVAPWFTISRFSLAIDGKEVYSEP